MCVYVCVSVISPVAYRGIKNKTKLFFSARRILYCEFVHNMPARKMRPHDLRNEFANGLIYACKFVNFYSFGT